MAGKIRHEYLRNARRTIQARLLGASTYNENTIYLHVLSWKDMPDKLPPIGKKIVAAEMLTTGIVTVKQDDAGIKLIVPQQYRDDIDTVIKLQLDGPAADIPTLVVPSLSLAAHKKIHASGTFDKASHGPEKILDDDWSTFWTAQDNKKQLWLELDLGKPVTFDHVLIHEAGSPWNRNIEKFQLRYKKDGDWSTFAEGTKVGPNYNKKIEPVTAQFVRFDILKAKNPPSIWEFQLFEPQN